MIKTFIPEGTRFWRWTTVSKVYRTYTSTGNGKTVVDVHCDCGTDSTIMVWNLRNGLSKGCKSCQPFIRNSSHFTEGESHSRYLGPGKTKLDIKIKWLLKEKSSPCVDCGRCLPPYCMEFDHVPGRGVKSFLVNLGTCKGRWTLEEMQLERQKCDLVCSICHNHRTWERDNNMPHVPLLLKDYIECGDSI